MKTFKIHLVREPQLSVINSETTAMVGEREERDVTITAGSCCEACIIAQHGWSGSQFTRWEEMTDADKTVTKV